MSTVWTPPVETAVTSEQAIIRDLGQGLVLRRAIAADAERVATFHANTLLGLHETGPLDRLYYWILDLMSGEHPSFQAGDFTLIEEIATGKIVSSTALLWQTWTYEGTPFPVGQPDVVSTDPAYRRRGLVRAQLDELHRWSEARGDLVQGITGIPWYYRQFGYEMALSLDAHRTGFRHHVPKLTHGERELYTFRPATADDLPFVVAMNQQASSRSAIAAVGDEALWRYNLEGRSDRSGFRGEARIIETAEPVPRVVGLLIHSQRLWGSGELGIRLFEVKAGVPLLAVTPGVLRYLDATGAAYAERDGEGFGAFSFNLVETHPLYETIPDRLPDIGVPYAWYIRVPDVPAFVQRIAPALEERLAASAQAGYTGELAISLYRSGLRLRFDAGQIAIEAWQPEHVEEGDAAFPDLTFLQLLFGFRSLLELRHAFPDCLVNSDDARTLLPILFPKKSSNVWPAG